MITSIALHLKRKKRERIRIKKVSQGKPRLSVNRTNKHIYAQIIDDNNLGKILASASTVIEAAKDLKSKCNVEAAKFVGKQIAEKAKKAGIINVVFDRSGFLYHGRVKALADSAREAGLNF